MKKNILNIKNSIHANRRWALIAAYSCLIIFVIFFLFPPYYMLITSLKTNKEIKIGENLNFGEIKIGKILINNPYPFALVKLFDPSVDDLDAQLWIQKIILKKYFKKN